MKQEAAFLHDRREVDSGVMNISVRTQQACELGNAVNKPWVHKHKGKGVKGCGMVRKNEKCL